MDFKTIEAPYLIQRGTFRDIPVEQIEGLDSLINYDYMGSSEFEFGALPHSLRRITYSWSQYVINKILDIQNQNGDKLYLLCQQNQFEELKSVIETLISNPNIFHTKERVGIKEYLECKSEYDMSFNFWWDVTEIESLYFGLCDNKNTIDQSKGNDWMACFGDENINKLIIAINKICIKHERTITQGPSLFEYNKKCREKIIINDDRKQFKVTYQHKTTTLIKRNIISFEIINDIIHVNIKTRNNNVIKINLPKSNERQYFINKLKEQIAFRHELSNKIINYDIE
jgi:hypothetical protein